MINDTEAVTNAEFKWKKLLNDCTFTLLQLYDRFIACHSLTKLFMTKINPAKTSDE